MIYKYVCVCVRARARASLDYIYDSISYAVIIFNKLKEIKL